MSLHQKLFIEKNWHRVFEFGVLLKGLNGLFELISGSVVLFVSKQTFINTFFHLTRAELLEDPEDKLVLLTRDWLQHLSANTQTFAAVYILLHGAINTFLTVQLYKQRLWAYKVAGTTIVVFMLYQIYRISYTHSVVLALITAWDILFLFVLRHEYHFHKIKQKNTSTT